MMMTGGGTENIRRFSMYCQHFKFRCHLLVNLITDRPDGCGIGSVNGVDHRNRPITIGVLVKRLFQDDLRNALATLARSNALQNFGGQVRLGEAFLHAAALSSLSTPRATISNPSSGTGLCSALAPSHGARIQTSRSSSVVSITGVALEWIGSTTAFSAMPGDQWRCT
jgi:hypothetical protein